MKHRKGSWRFAALAIMAPLVLTLTPGLAEAQIIRHTWDWVKKHTGTTKSATATPSHELPWQGFSCCNLHFDGDRIDDGNFAELPMIPAGTPIEVLKYEGDTAYVKVSGRAMRLEHKFGRDQESLDAWANKIVVDTDPRPRISAYPAPVREAIYQGKVMVGMTREQALAAVGYPRTSENFSPDVPVWRVWRSKRGEYQLNFRSDGQLASVTGDDEVTAPMIYRPGRFAEAPR